MGRDVAGRTEGALRGNLSLTASQGSVAQSGARYFFHAVNGTKRLADKEGVYVESAEDIRGLAAQACRELLDEAPLGTAGWRLEVTNANDETVLVLSLDRDLD